MCVFLAQGGEEVMIPGGEMQRKKKKKTSYNYRSNIKARDKTRVPQVNSKPNQRAVNPQSHPTTSRTKTKATESALSCAPGP